jgi:acetolactate synthase-1/2/3 large subunit
MRVADADRRNTILLHDAGVTRAYVSHSLRSVVSQRLHRFRWHQCHGLVYAGGHGREAGPSGKTVVNVTGDGSFGLTGMEIETAARNDIRTLTVILNNESLGASRETLHERFKLFLG